MSIRSLPRHLAVAVGLGLALAAAAPTLSAAAEPSSVTARLTESAALIAKGAAVEIPVVYTCSPDAIWGRT